MSPAPVYSPGYQRHSPTTPSKQEFVELHEQYMSGSPWSHSSQSPQMQGQGHPSPLMHQQQQGRPVSPQHPQQAHHRSHHLNLQQQQQQQ
jgi:hypothetical protein